VVVVLSSFRHQMLLQLFVWSRTLTGRDGADGCGWTEHTPVMLLRGCLGCYARRLFGLMSNSCSAFPVMHCFLASCVFPVHHSHRTPLAASAERPVTMTS